MAGFWPAAQKYHEIVRALRNARFGACGGELKPKIRVEELTT